MKKIKILIKIIYKDNFFQKKIFNRVMYMMIKKIINLNFLTKINI